MSKNKGLDRNYAPNVPYGPATGVEDPGRKPIVDGTPRTGDYSPDGAHEPGHVTGGPGHDECDHE